MPWVGLRRAVADLLLGNPSAGIPPRSMQQVISRMNRTWYQGNGPERSAPGYRPWTDAPADQPIRNPSSWLAAALLQQDCPRPDCEDGTLLPVGAPCRLCEERHTEHRAARQAADHARQLMYGAMRPDTAGSDRRPLPERGPQATAGRA
ncbi:hypothetical protein [Streptomyces sp. H39-C1]|uniref:hypothetical protein n=1 Tax=Streptomyces sp. H39-C1 TaxID=3004355 RepID=UPI0022AF3851|nr:hypothetical protein [Streptomyces sp. H39-C1]MCZ4101054.1 hypothetical protein [Streptomyces sp. H39-C1]